MLVPIPVSEVMSSPVETVAPHVSIRDVASRFRAADIGSLVMVLDDRPVGIVTESDLVQSIALDHDHDEPVREIVSSPLVTVEPTVVLEDAARRLRDHRIKRLPVVDGEDLVGIVTTTDLSSYLPYYALRVRPREHPRSDWRFEYQGRAATGVKEGDVVRFSKRLTEEDVRAFAAASGDHNRLHLDADYARATRFGRPIVHGVLTAGVISAALARLPGLTIYLSQNTSFLAPVEVGAEVTAVCEVIDDLGSGRFRLTTHVFDADDQQVIDGEAVVLVDDAPEVVPEALELQAGTS